MIADLSAPYRRPRHQWERQLDAVRWVVGGVLGAVLFLVLLGGVAYGGSSGGTQIVKVAPGDTVWGIASAHYDDPDLRDRVDQIVALNHLHGAGLVPGQRLVLPP